MNKEAYNFIEHQEETHWWFVARRNIILNVINKSLKKKNPKVVDIGCGSGLFLNHLRKYSSDVQGVDSYAEIQSKSSNIIHCDITRELPYNDNSLDFVLMLDVLEHIEDDNKFINNIYSKISNEGQMLITVPALQFLYSNHDKSHNHYRRYNKKQLVNILENAGFEVEKVSYMNFLLFPFALVSRCLDKFSKKPSIDKEPNKIMNYVFKHVFEFEKYLINKISLPIGLSIILVAKKKPID